MPKILLPHLALFCANSIYAINYIFAKDVMPHYLGPSGFILLRVMGAFLVFSLVHHFFIKEEIHRKDIVYLIFVLFSVLLLIAVFFQRFKHY